MKIIREAVELERFTKIIKDANIFISNTRKIRNKEQISDLIEGYMEWKKYTLDPFLTSIIGKNLDASYDFYNDKNVKTTVKIELKRLEEALDSLMSISEAQARKFDKDLDMLHDFINEVNMKYGSGSIYIHDVFGYMEKISQAIETSEFVPFQRYFEEIGDYYTKIWEKVANSKYISAKRTVDSVEERISDRIPMYGDMNVMQTLYRDGVRIELSFPEHLEELMYKAVKTVESAISIISKFRHTSRILGGLKIRIDFTSKIANKDIVTSAGSSKAAGLYFLKTGEILISKHQVTTNDIIVVLAHELGHKYYYEIMNKGQRLDWEKYFDEIQPSHVRVSKMLSKAYDKVENILDNSVKNESNKILQNLENFIGGVLFYYTEISGFNEVMKSYEGNITNFIEKIIEPLVKTLKIKPKNGKLLISDLRLLNLKIWKSMKLYFDNLERSKLPSHYANENPSEAFAEIFAMNIIKSKSIKTIQSYRFDQDIYDNFRRVSGIRESSNIKR